MASEKAIVQESGDMFGGTGIDNPHWKELGLRFGSEEAVKS